ncbi:MAG: DUF2125 domain-containing protein, partial [Pseudomonadota bacterium]
MAGESPLGMMRAGRQRRRSDAATSLKGRRRLIAAPIAIVAPIAAVIVLALAWSGLWFLAASIAQRTLAAWEKREAAAGRVYSCTSQAISGFPFSIRVRCVEPAAALNFYRPPLTVEAKDVTFRAPVYRPTLLVGKITGPLTVAEQGHSPNFVAAWSLARIRLSGLPLSPDAVSVSIERPHLDQIAGAYTVTVFTANNARLEGRIVGGAADNHPVIDAVLQFASATAPSVHSLLADPVSGRIEIVLRGFKNLSPKPLPEHFRELQAAGGTIEIKSLRLDRSDAAVAGAGTLTVDDRGRLDGLLRVAVSGLEKIVPQLGIDRLIDQGIDRLTGSSGQPGHGLSSLDRLM